MDTVFKCDKKLLVPLPGKKGDPQSKFPQVRVDRETYERLRKLRFKLELESMDEVIAWLLKRETENGKDKS
jgi:hypothetical protein